MTDNNDLSSGNGDVGPGGLLSSEVEEQLRVIFDTVKAQTGQDLGLYKESTILRRIERRMGANNIADLGSYTELLRESRQEVQDLCQDILIGVTSFFRDPEAFGVLAREVLPQLFADREPDDPVRIWHAGCATGEEAYSTAILAREFLAANNLSNRVLIFATDLDEDAIIQARSGFFADGIAAVVGEKRLQQFFTRQAGRYQVNKAVREMIVFAHHNLLKDPPFSHLDLIVCRNFLIYLTPEMQNRLIALFYQALKTERFLFLGSAETVGKHTDLFDPINKTWRIFQRRAAGQRPDTSFHFTPSLLRLPGMPRFSRPAAETPGPTVVVEKLLLERYTPPCVVVNEKYQVVYVSPRTNRFLEVPVGEPTRDVLKMVRKEVRPLLRTAIHKAFSEQQQVVFRNLKMSEGGESTTVNLQVDPLGAAASTRHLAMVLFKTAPVVVSAAPSDRERTIPRDGSSADELVAHLEDQLRVTQEQLQATIEQLETSNEGFMATNEELIAINEEFQSTNEELQSTNEELETSKEELQAFNEELATINAELQKKVEELDRANADMENLFASSAIAAIFLDPQLNIQRFSPAMARIFNLIPADIGRPFRRLAGAIDWFNFAEDAAVVLETWASTERELEGLENGRHYLMRVLPYRTTQGRVDGIVVTFVDITQRKRVEEHVRSIALFPEENPSPVMRVALDGKILFANRAAAPLLAEWRRSVGEWVPDFVGRELVRVLKSATIGEMEIRCGQSDLAVMLVPIAERNYVNIYGHDITERKRVGEALRENERALRNAQQAARIGTYVYDIPADLWNSSPMLDRIFGIDADFPRSSAGWAQLIHPESREELLAYLGGCIAEHRRFDIEYRIIRHSDGEERWVLGMGEIEYAADGQPLRMIGTIQDVTARRAAEAELQLRDRAIEASSNGIMICAARRRSLPILYVNPAFERIAGYRSADILGRNPSFLVGRDAEQKGVVELRSALRRQEEAEVELRTYRPDGSLFWSRLSVAPVRAKEGRISHFVAVFDDITERKNYEQKLEYQASHDALTGLANRHLLTDRLSQSLIYAGRSQRIVGVLLLDLDRFKVVNDTLGHSRGDELLRQVAERLNGCVRPGDTVSRLGGDEFLVALAEVAEPDDLGMMARRIRDKLVEPFQLAGHELRVTASMGISLYPRDGREVDTLICHADIAMYRAKEEGGDSFRFFAPEMNLRVQGTLKLETDLRQALEREEYRLHYQPKVDAVSGRINGCEALVRWQPAGRDLVAPGAFIPLAEETGLIVPLGAWVLREACAQAKTWQESGLLFGKIAVNLSARQFRQADLIDQVRAVLAETGLDPSYLELELTESMIMSDPARAAETMRQLKDIGIGLCLDDFGTGYSNLNYLRRFPVDYLKIDRSFILDVATDPSGAAVAKSIVAIAHSLGIGAVAEGVESWEQFDFLAESRCDAMQGFLFSRPLVAAAFAGLLEEDRPLIERVAGHPIGG